MYMLSPFVFAALTHWQCLASPVSITENPTYYIGVGESWKSAHDAALGYCESTSDDYCFVVPGECQYLTGDSQEVVYF